MNRQTLFTIGKGIILILIIMAIVFALKAPAADLNALDGDGKNGKRQRMGYAQECSRR